jgi:hypothetical protein
MNYYYQQVIRVFEKSRAFSSLDIGDTFTKAGQTIGFGNIFAGFDIYIKTSEIDATEIRHGRTKAFKEEEKVLLIKYGLVENRG